MAGSSSDDAFGAVHELKTRYVQLMDSRCWQEWATLFAVDAVLDAGDDMEFHGLPRERGVVRGRDRIVTGSRRALDGTSSRHTVSLRTIDVVGPDRAFATWAMTDRIEHPDGRTLTGSGVYHDEYRRADGGWEIHHIRLERTMLAWQAPEG